MTEQYHAGSAIDAYEPEDWITGSTPLTTIDVIVKAGAGVVPMRSVMGVITADGKTILSLNAAIDGSEIAAYVLAYEVDATGSDVTAQAYATGCFNPDLLNLGAGQTAENIKESLRDRGILLKTPA